MSSPPKSPLAELLHAIGSKDRVGKSAESEGTAESPSDPAVAEGLRVNLVAAIRKELGAAMGDLAEESLRGEPLTRETAERILQAASRMAAARQVAFLAAGLSPRLDVPAAGHASQRSSQVEELTRARWMSKPERSRTASLQNEPAPATPGGSAQPATVSPAPPVSAPLSARELRLPVPADGRHAALLEYCRELVRESHSDPDEAARQLHDRVRTFLERRGRWPLSGADDYERHAKPAAIVIATWNVSDT